MEASIVTLKKQPQKYLSKVDGNTYKKLRKALHGLEEWKGDIVKLKGSNYYRLKIPQYRFIFIYDNGINIISIEEINIRTNWCVVKGLGKQEIKPFVKRPKYIVDNFYEVTQSYYLLP